MGTLIATDSLWQAVLEHSVCERTGTFFLACAANKSGQIVLNKGQLLGITYAGETGKEAVAALKQAKALRFSFNDDLIFPVQETLLPDQSEALLNGLGLAEYAKEHPSVAAQEKTEVPPMEAKKPVRIYRGRVVQG